MNDLYNVFICQFNTIFGVGKRRLSFCNNELSVSRNAVSFHDETGSFIVRVFHNIFCVDLAILLVDKNGPLRAS